MRREGAGRISRPAEVTSAPAGPRHAARNAAGPATPARPGGHLDGATLLGLQGRVGNTRVTQLLRGLQRAPLDAADDPAGYTKAGGVRNVRSSGTSRVEVRGLTYGLSGGFSGRYKTSMGSLTSAEAKMTKQTPEHMAVVVLPDTVVAGRPVQVVLHFTGWGFREDSDPYAGYTVAAGGPSSKQGAQGTVRDVDQEHWAQQIGAVNAARAEGAPQTVAILAQGRGPSDFGNVPTFDYVKDVLGRVPALAGVTQYSLVLSGHSGGGSTQVAKKTGDVRAAAGSRAPSDLVVLFDAEGVESVTGWAIGQVAALRKRIKAAATAADAQAIITASPKFRGYFAENGGYHDRYLVQNDALQAALAAVPRRWSLRDTEDPGGVKVHDLFRFIKVPGAGHESVISGGKDRAEEKGALADALNASTDPTRDRARSLPSMSKAEREGVEKRAEEKLRRRKEAAEKRAAEKAAKEKAGVP